MHDYYDVVVIGGGAQGLFTAIRLAEEGVQPVVVRLDDSPSPQADTLRAGGLVHSGILYGSDARLYRLSRSCRREAFRQLSLIGMAPPTGYGVCAVRTEAKASDLQKVSYDLGLNGEVDRLNDAELQDEIGDLYESGDIGLRIPDAPIDFGLMLEKARALAVQLGVRFVTVKNPVILHRGVSGFGTLSCTIGEETVDVGNLILAAGAGTPALLDQIDIPHAIELYSTPCLRAPRVHGLNAATAVKLDGRKPFFATKAPSRDESPESVIFSGGRKLVEASEFHKREIIRSELEFIEESVPLRVRMMSPVVWTGLKAEKCGQGPQHFIMTPQQTGFSNLYAVLPGKAMMALATADELVLRMQVHGLNAKETAIPIGSVMPWVEPVRMIHDPSLCGQI